MALTNLEGLAPTDFRLDPETVETAVRRALELWSLAMDGDDAALVCMIDPWAVQQMLYWEGEGKRLFVRDLKSSGSG